MRMMIEITIITKITNNNTIRQNNEIILTATFTILYITKNYLIPVDLNNNKSNGRMIHVNSSIYKPLANNKMSRTISVCQNCWESKAGTCNLYTLMSMQLLTWCYPVLWPRTNERNTLLFVSLFFVCVKNRIRMIDAF